MRADNVKVVSSSLTGTSFFFFATKNHYGDSCLLQECTYLHEYTGICCE